MAYITNGGARLIERARLDGKSLVFGSVRMNTIFEPTPDELVYRSDEWFGANVGEVVGCLSHVSVDDVSCVCDSKLAVQCNDNSEPWKSIGIYAHLDGEVDELLFACESIQNGEYKDVTIVELPVTLDGVVEDFGLSEGGSGGGGGGEGGGEGSTAPLTGTWDNFVGAGSMDNPEDGDRHFSENLTVGSGEASIILEELEIRFDGKEGFWVEENPHRLEITAERVSLNNNTVSASWGDILDAASRSVPDTRAGRGKVSDEGENLWLFGNSIVPEGSFAPDGIQFAFDSSGYLESVSNDSGYGIATISVIVKNGKGVMVENGRISGVSADIDTPLTFQSPIQLQAGYTITYQAIFSSL